MQDSSLLVIKFSYPDGSHDYMFKTDGTLANWTDRAAANRMCERLTADYVETAKCSVDNYDTVQMSPDFRTIQKGKFYYRVRRGVDPS